MVGHYPGVDSPKEIPLTRGCVALVSPEDYEAVSAHKWHVTSGGYAARTDRTGAMVYMHRFINDTPDGLGTDHRDTRDRLNNTRENLRDATTPQNGANQRKRFGDLSSQFKGVCFVPGRGENPLKNAKWVAYVTCDQQRYHLGHFVTELDAAFAYNLRAKELFGEFAALNPLPMDYLETHSEPLRFAEPTHSKHKGVTKHKPSGLWMAYVQQDGKRIHTSYHKTEDAAIAKRQEVTHGRI